MHGLNHMRLALLSVLALSAPGCAWLRPLPPPLARDDVVESVRRAAAQFRTVTDSNAKLLISETADGKTRRAPSLGGSFGFERRRPALYLLAEKLGQTVFWLRANERGFWLDLPRTQELVTGGPAAYAKLPMLIRPEDVRGFFAGPEQLGLTWPATTMTVDDDSYRFDVYALGVLHRQVFVDRRRLALVRVRDVDAVRRTVTDVTFGGHARSGGLLFPRRFIIARPRIGLTVELRLRDPQVNADINPAAFEPSDRPGARHIDLDYEDVSAVKFFTME